MAQILSQLTFAKNENLELEKSIQDFLQANQDFTREKLEIINTVEENKIQDVEKWIKIYKDQEITLKANKENAGDTLENKKKARRYCRFAVRQKKIPFASHLFFPQFMNDNDPTERGIGLQLGISYIFHCKEVWVFGDTISNGMQAEIDAARRMNKKIRYFTEDMEEKTHEVN